MDDQHTIKTINQIFFDSFAALGDEAPEFIEEYQDVLWRETVAFAVSHLRRSQPQIVALEVGAGKGYATMALYEHLRTTDVLVCNDISAGMLARCKTKVEAASAQRGNNVPRVSFVQGSYDSIHMAVRPNLVFMNSVAHHMPDLPDFFRHLDAQLTPGGVLVLGREPNHAFWNHWFLFPLNLWIVRAGAVVKILARLFDRPPAFSADSADTHAAKIAVERLRQQGITRVGAIELTAANIGTFVDYQAPQGATPEDKQKGLAVDQIIREFLPSAYQALLVRSYSHIGTVKSRGLIRPVDQILSRLFPSSGMHVGCVLEKQHQVKARFDEGAPLPKVPVGEERELGKRDAPSPAGALRDVASLAGAGRPDERHS